MKCDVAIIGGGPAGATAGNLLAQEGIRTIIVEKSAFPRFHIGESLLPCDAPVFERLGVKLEPAAFLRKNGADFIDEGSERQETYLFSDGLKGSASQAWQVDRARFDHMLLERATEVGSIVFQNERITSVEIDDSSVRLQTTHREIEARYVIDASGQDAFFARRNRSVRPIKGFGRAAVFCHFQGISAHISRELATSGNIRILLVPEGWVWVIPLMSGRLSVGVVSRAQGVNTFLLDKVIERSVLIRRLTEGAARTKATVIRNFSYINQRSHGARYACIGDSACFLDPVFSSGVSLAMLGAAHVADILIPALRGNEEGRSDLLAEHTQHMVHGYKAFGALIHSFYHTSLAANLFFAKEVNEDMRAGLISMLAGDIWRPDNRFQNSLAQSARRQPDIVWDSSPGSFY
ncbi:MAG: tryptophan 7-halogenase [Myxococcales bacterium]|nr:tryptophan 7-halogenase [Myxococcales bacterium]MCB9708876.1 tryptophan 7-halogenase [Myxococcales bacterium]